MRADLSSVIAATTRWLVRAYPGAGGPVTAALAEAQARQAVTVAAWLRYPTALDAMLVATAGPGGCARLDWAVGTDSVPDRVERPDGPEHAWRSWVDETVASWAGCLLAEPALASAAVAALAGCEHVAPGTPVEFRRLTAPGEHDRRAAALLRHPDLTAPVAALHRAPLLERLDPDPAHRGAD